MLSNRATGYLSQLERRQLISDVDEVRAAFASRSKHGQWSIIAAPEAEVGHDEEQFRRYGLAIDDFASCRHTTFWYNSEIIVRHR